jgi:hypothetical protein
MKTLALTLAIALVSAPAVGAEQPPGTDADQAITSVMILTPICTPSAIGPVATGGVARARSASARSARSVRSSTSGASRLTSP